MLGLKHPEGSGGGPTIHESSSFSRCTGCIECFNILKNNFLIISTKQCTITHGNNQKTSPVIYSNASLARDACRSLLHGAYVERNRSSLLDVLHPQLEEELYSMVENISLTTPSKHLLHLCIEGILLALPQKVFPGKMILCVAELLEKIEEGRKITDVAREFDIAHERCFTAVE
ncbi:hypothetical protein TNCV_3525091 [Trichonephila clavipes]|uniref:Uncharacterized protein n=1 Tax=Trichonephila clavipes TaxID=2585209 RepID=A0A8X6VG68_TRICX|nr:hypothetical protein TNCV_3525091 [Trichonephila clavipes]